jgi:pimeloyl-ACP methyl ester carboxylesterase
MKLNKLGSGTLVLVPGIMGSELRLNRIDSTGVRRDDLVWGEDASVVWNTLSREPELLSAQDLVATKVIHSIRTSGALWSKNTPIYGPLIDFCCAKKGLNLKDGRTFRQFAYDWRLDLITTASSLDNFVQKLPDPVFIVAHSMGGLITRLMLNLKLSGASKVKGVFQIASPVAGSSKAYISLKNRLDLGSIPNLLLNFSQRLHTGLNGRLREAIGNMDALYQLLPPSSYPILLTRGGTQLAATDVRGWVKSYQPFITAAGNVHKVLATVPSVPIKCVYAVDIDTDWMLQIDDGWNILARKQTALGDGTVICASASAGSVDTVPIKGEGKAGEHTKLCACKKVHEELREFLS